MSKYKIVFSDYYYPDNDKEIEILKELGDVEIVDGVRLKPGGFKTEQEVLELAKDADGLIVQFAAISKDVIDQLDKCRIISRYAIGVDNIDVAAARDKGIVVANVPDYCIEEVSDSALGHILNAQRKIALADRLIRSGGWAYEKIRPIQRLDRLTVGLMGFGNIAQRLAEKLRPLNVRIITYDPYTKVQDRFEWVEFVSMDDLLARSDVISIHVPMNQETRHLINRDKIARMKDGVTIVNTARGGVVDEKALEDGIVSGKIGMLGLDVLDCPDEDYPASPLYQYPEKVTITPHFGWYSEQAIEDLQCKTARNIVQFFKDGAPLYSV